MTRKHTETLVVQSGPATSCQRQKENMKTFDEILKEGAARMLKEHQKQYGEKSGDLKNIESELLRDIRKNTPVRYENAWFPSEKLFEKVYTVLSNKRGMYFYGGVGTGKTYLLYAIHRLIMAKSLKARVVNLPDFLSLLKAFYSDKYEGENAIQDAIKSRAIFLIDDVGAEKISEWSLDIFYQLINYRYEQNLSTFFGSNLTLEQLAKQYGDRIVSRITEMCEIIKHDGPDRRLPKNHV